jgi:hypothetical protein
VVAADPNIDAPAAPAAGADLAERVRALQAEARRLAGQHVEALAASLVETQRLAAEIAAGGEAYPPGVRDLAARLCEESAAKAQTLAAIMGRI